MALGQLGSRDVLPVLIQALNDSDKDVRWRAVLALGQIGSTESVPVLAQALNDSDENLYQQALKALSQIGEPSVLATMWQRCFQRPDPSLWEAIAKIQNRCRFYNHKLWQEAEFTSTQPQTNNMTEKSEYNAKYVINGSPTIVEGNMDVKGDNVGTKNVHNYFGVDPALSQEIADLQQFITTIEADHPNLKTEQEANQTVTAALDQLQTQEPTRWQKLRQQMGILKRQLRNPERHLQAAKTTGIEVAKHYAENSLIVKAVITYLETLSETPDQGP